MLEEDPDAPIGLLWAEQDGRGVHINISGGGVTRYADDVDLAQQFLEWLATDGQDTLVADNHEYPANPAVAAEPLIVERFGTDFVRDPLHGRVLGSLNPGAVRRWTGRLRLTGPVGHRREPTRRRVDRRPAWVLGRRRRRGGRSSSSRSPCSPPACSAPSTEVWRQQWGHGCPARSCPRSCSTGGVVAVSVVLGVGLAWLVGAHEFPGRRRARLGARPAAGDAGLHPRLRHDRRVRRRRTDPGLVAGSVRRATPGSPRSARCPGAIVTLSLTLYPYVYLLARAALRDQAAAAYLVARTLGASRPRPPGVSCVPMLRPAIAAGAAIVAMETLTDFATVQYFNVETLTVGVFRIWRGTYDRDAAASSPRSCSCSP